MLYYLAVALNGLELLMAGVLLSQNGMPRDDEFFLVLLVLFTPIVSLFYLITGRPGVNTESLLGLYLKRQRLKIQSDIQKMEK